MNVSLEGVSAIIAALAALIPAIVVGVNLVRDTLQSTRRLEIGGHGPVSAWLLALTRAPGGAAAPLREQRDSDTLKRLARYWVLIGSIYGGLIFLVVALLLLQTVRFDIGYFALSLPSSPIFYGIFATAYLSYFVVGGVCLANGRRIRKYIKEERELIRHDVELQISISPRSNDDQKLIMQCLVAVKAMGAKVQTWDSECGLLTSNWTEPHLPDHRASQLSNG